MLESKLFQKCYLGVKFDSEESSMFDIQNFLPKFWNAVSHWDSGFCLSGGQLPSYLKLNFLKFVGNDAGCESKESNKWRVMCLVSV